MPLFYELLIRQGVPPGALLAETHLTAAEEILDSVARHEFGERSFAEHVLTCRQTLAVRGVSPARIGEVEQQLVSRPFSLVPAAFTALTRANTFLYATALASDDFGLIHRTWEMIMPLLLFLDDVTDLAADRAAGEENCLLQGGTPVESFFRLYPVLARLVKQIEPIHPEAHQRLNALRLPALTSGFLKVTLAA
ncbi:MAG: hypothetical protein MUC38_06370 [Cyclobacteriaceae bacterium]|nr:hypothetical protein [Cyclobacteriaceae bacterium]